MHCSKWLGLESRYVREERSLVAALIPIFYENWAYLLVALLFVVTCLAVSALGLVVRRVLMGKAFSEPSEEEQKELPPATLTKEQQVELERLIAELQSIESENGLGDGFPKLNEALRAKLKLLESRLMEYEILQEEMGALSVLRLENQRLKEELSSLEGAQKGQVLFMGGSSKLQESEVAQGAVDAVFQSKQK